MAQTVYPNDQLSDPDFESNRKLPTGLNVLTILTIIGCILGILGSGWNFTQAKKNYDQRGEMAAKMNDPKVPSFVKALMPDPEHFDEMMTKSYENKLPILMVSLIAYGLCFFGALQMRKRKKQGYLLYVIGELLPFLSAVFFIGTFSLTGVAVIISIAISLLFILLYTVQRKHLIY